MRPRERKREAERERPSERDREIARESEREKESGVSTSPESPIHEGPYKPGGLDMSL